jgi:hypothetical protein
MASFTLNRTAKFPEETVVKAYPKSNWPTPTLTPSGEPIGAATEEATVTEGAAAFAELAADTEYWAHAEVGTEHVYIAFRTSQPREVTGKRNTGEGALKNLLAALASEGIITDATTKE